MYILFSLFKNGTVESGDLLPFSTRKAYFTSSSTLSSVARMCVLSCEYGPFEPYETISVTCNVQQGELGLLVAIVGEVNLSHLHRYIGNNI